MRRVILLSFSLVLLLVSAGRAETEGSPTCSGFPWTVTASPYGADSVAVRICGTFAGCRPRNPQFTISGSEIHVSLTQGDPPNCMCIAVVDTFEQAVVVHPLTPGAYTVTVTLLSCGPPLAAGSTDFVFGASSAIPTLNPIATAALALLLAAVAVLRVRA